MSNKPNYNKPSVDMKRYRDFKLKISQIPPMDIAFQNMAINEYEILTATIYRLNDLIEVHNKYTEKIDEILEWLINDGLELAVLEQLNVWLNDGTLEMLINETLFTKKLDKTEFEDYKTAINQVLSDLEQVIDDEISRLDGEINRVDGELEDLKTNKADKTYVDGELNRVDGELEDLEINKADKTYLDIELQNLEFNKLDKSVFNSYEDEQWYVVKEDDDLHDIFNSKRKIILSGEFEIDRTLIVKSNTTIISNDALIYAKQGYFAQTSDRLMYMFKIENVVILGTLKLKMNKEEYTTGEWRHGLEITSCKNISIQNLDIRSTGGDGLYIGDYQSTDPTQDLFIDNLNVDNARRNGLSLISGIRIVINNITCTNISGTSPQAGVDFEPNASTSIFRDIKIGKINTRNCKGASLIICPAWLQNGGRIEIDIGSVVSNGDNHGLYLLGARNQFGHALDGHLNIEVLKISRPVSNAILIENWQDRFPFLTVESTTILDGALRGFYMYGSHDTTYMGKLIFKNVYIDTPFPAVVIGYQQASTFSFLDILIDIIYTKDKRIYLHENLTNVIITDRSGTPR